MFDKKAHSLVVNQHKCRHPLYTKNKQAGCQTLK